MIGRKVDDVCCPDVVWSKFGDGEPYDKRHVAEIAKALENGLGMIGQRDC